ncbi:MAG: cytidine deaminase [Kiritimatiellia bacterium]
MKTTRRPIPPSLQKATGSRGRPTSRVKAQPVAVTGGRSISRTAPMRKLRIAARAAAARAYCPYSHFAVGAALLADNGRIFTGANVENASYGLTICAERVALLAAVAAGVRRFRALAVAAGADTPATPCGACRQVLAEFCDDHLPIVCCTLTGSKPTRTTLGALLPKAFRKAPDCAILHEMVNFRLQAKACAHEKEERR